MGCYRRAKIKSLLVGLQLTGLHGFWTKNREADSSEDDYCYLWGTGPAATCAFQTAYNDHNPVPVISPTISRAAAAASQVCSRNSWAVNDVVIDNNFEVKAITNVTHKTEIHRAVILQNLHEKTRIVAFCSSLRYDKRFLKRGDSTYWATKELRPADGHMVHVIKYYYDIFEEFSPWLNENLHSRSQSIVLTGYGVGGAVAVVARLLLYRDHLFGVKPELITFGAPMVGDTSFAMAIKKDGMGDYLRYDFCGSLTMIILKSQYTMRQNNNGGTEEKPINLSLSGTAVILGADSNHEKQYFVQRRQTPDKNIEHLCQPKTRLQALGWSWRVPVVRSIDAYIDYLQMEQLM